jgi:hypothetical protein
MATVIAVRTSPVRRNDRLAWFWDALLRSLAVMAG